MISVKFGTYKRDGFTGLDYADQRYYAATYGRLNTADPYRASAGASDPGSWNRYVYVGGDPVNFNDATGLARAATYSDGIYSPGFYNPEDPYSIFNSGFTGGYYGGSLNSRLVQVRDTFDFLAGIIEDWDYANASGTAYNLSIGSDFVDSLVLGGAIQISGNGTASIGGIAITLGQVAAAANPVVLTVAGIAATGTVAYYVYQYYKKQSQAGQSRDISKAIDRLRRDCGRGLTPEERGKVHDQITGQDLSVDEILDIMKAVTKCR